MEDIRNLKVADLKNELKQRKLSTAGKKADLISRLEAYFTEAKGGQVRLTIDSSSFRRYDEVFGKTAYFNL